MSLQKCIIDDNGCKHDYIKQVAQSAAIIHNTPISSTTDFQELDIPPYECWYEYFLSVPALKDRIGDSLFKRLSQYIENNLNLISEIEKYKSVIHSDFRPANMLVNNSDEVYFVDWEYACVGHSLADIGQFFRYTSYFTENDRKLFETEYNKYTNKILPDNWFELARFRDLINPMQMIPYGHASSLRCQDLINVIDDIISK